MGDSFVKRLDRYRKAEGKPLLVHGRMAEILELTGGNVSSYGDILNSQLEG